jgi:hypothetical protein
MKVETDGRIHCSSCGSEVASEDVNLQTLVARCRTCQVVFDATAQIRRDPASDSLGPIPLKERAQAARPDSITVEEGATVARSSAELTPYRSPAVVPPTFTLVRRWYSSRYLLQLAFCVFWFGFLGVWYSKALSGGNLTMILFPLLHVGAGVWLSYSTLAGFLNRSRISVRDGFLEVRHGPIPWRGNRRIPVAELEQLYCEEQVSTNSKGHSGPTYRLNAILRGGRKLTLLSGLTAADQALFLEQEIERRLEIPDRAVADEYRFGKHMR